MAQRLDTRSADITHHRRSAAGQRVPPHNVEAEESLLGAMLLSRDAISAAVELQLGAEDFYKPAHGHIYDAITTLYSQGEPADPVTVSEQLARAGLLDAVGGGAMLISVQARTPAISNAPRYARIVEEHALLRRLIAVAGEVAEMGYQVPEDVTAAVDQAEAMVFEVAQRRVTDSLSPIRELLERQLDRIEALYGRGDEIVGVPTGYVDLDRALSGLQPSSLVVVGARPGMGKTSWALGAAAHAALEARVPVLVFSLEMGHLEVTQRMLSAEARVDATRLRNGRLLETDWPKISHAVGRLAEAPIHIDDNPHLTVMEIRAKARRLKARGGLGLVVIDYLQLMTGRHGAENRQVEVSEISRGLKILARELEVPVVALSQLSRNLESRADKRPILADLRESGCLTADTRVTRSDTGVDVALGALLAAGERDIPVWSLDERMRLVPDVMTHVFATGVKPVFELRLRSGRRVTATANHRFRTLGGWARLDELGPGALLAVPHSGLGAAAGHWVVHPEGAPVVHPDGPPTGHSGRVVTLTAERHERTLIEADTRWDEVVSISNAGRKPVYDATVASNHNFVANGVVVHNSIEQDSDIVIFLYRDELYNRDSPDRGTAEVIVAKHRNGPVGVTSLAFLETYTKFANMAGSELDQN
ncbi:MAG: replicative DNA helicase [Actinomycetota bacterium]|nr:replicative DNA helicase [Actinomycetota bacterium]